MLRSFGLGSIAWPGAALGAAWVNYALTHGIVKRKRAVLMRKRMIYCNRT